MINNKNDLKYYIEADRKASMFPRHKIAAAILREPKYMICRYLYYLRKCEYATNVIAPRHRYIGKLLRVYYHYMMRRLSFKLGFQIPENVFGPGLKIYAYGTIIVNGRSKVGKNCTIYPGVTLGGKVENGYPIIGDNVYIGLGAKVLGGVTVGDNVYIAPNAVVVKDILPNCVVGGIPAKILKYRNEESISKTIGSKPQQSVD